MEKLLDKHTKQIVKEIKAITREEDPKPGREFELYLIEATLPQDFKGLYRD